MYDKKLIKKPTGFVKLIGLKYHKCENGVSRFSLKITKNHKNPNNVVHGGVIISLADTGMGAALNSLLKQDEFCTSIEIKMNFLLPVFSGTISADTRVVHKGNRIAFFESVVTNEKGEKVAVASGSFFIFRKPPLVHCQCNHGQTR